MSGIGIIMFWKAVIVTLWVAILHRWNAYKQGKTKRGLQLSRNRKGVYVVRDWTSQVDFAFRVGRRALYVMVFAWWAFLGYYCATGQYDHLGKIIGPLFAV